MKSRSELLDLTLIRRVKLRLLAGASGFQTEPDLTNAEPLAMPSSVIRALNSYPQRLLALRVRDSGMEPMLFVDDWIVIDTEDTVMRSREVYAVNWNGEACVHQLVERGGQWYLNYLNPNVHPFNARSGQLNIVGHVVYQPGRVVTGGCSDNW